MYINPYDSINDGKGKWYKANFHIHAGTGAGTCGKHGIDEVVVQYRELGYDVLTISNHDLLTDMQQYDKADDLIFFNGYEYSHGIDMLCIDVNEAFTGTTKEVAEKCLKNKGLLILCHPHYEKEDYWPKDQIDELKGYIGIEIYNGACFRFPGYGLATDVWDYVLSGGKLIWGFGSDDFHSWCDLGKVWNMIYSTSNERESIKQSIINGSFYVSTGPILNELAFDGTILTVRAGLKDSYVKNNNYRFIGEKGKVLSEIYGESGVYEFKKDDKFVRVQVVSDHGAVLFTQPIYLKQASWFYRYNRFFAH